MPIEILADEITRIDHEPISSYDRHKKNVEREESLSRGNNDSGDCEHDG